MPPRPCKWVSLSTLAFLFPARFDRQPCLHPAAFRSADSNQPACSLPCSYAKSWGNIHIVAAAWLEDSLRLGVRQDEAKYAMHSATASSRSKSRGQGSKDSAEPQQARWGCQRSTCGGS